MHFVRFRSASDPRPRVGVLADGGLTPLTVESAAELWRRGLDELRELTETLAPQPVTERIQWLPPIDGRTEVWAAGVTYLRSRDARVEESSQRTVYEQVYDASRPELFYKAAAWRVVTDGEPVAIREDSLDNVPEPELAVLVGADGASLGYLVCNDMSSRSIEGENPLYLPQAKVYAGSCALSVGVRPAWEVDPADLTISMSITRGGATVFRGETRTSQMRRPPNELAEHLMRGDHFPDGVVLSTGTGIVPPLGEGVRQGDEVVMSIDGVGALRNPVVAGSTPYARLADGVRPPN
jgi:2-dehydro-3-deoxy-D-arabinonate dehydratase